MPKGGGYSDDGVDRGIFVIMGASSLGKGKSTGRNRGAGGGSQIGGSPIGVGHWIVGLCWPETSLGKNV